MQNNFENIEQFAIKNLGQAQADKMLKTYEEDYLKSFVSGVGQNNPTRALQLLDDEEIKKSFSNPEQYLRMRGSLENRQKRLQVASEKKARLNSVQAGISGRSKMSSMNYAQRQIFYEKNNISPEVQSLYDELDGYAKSRKAIKGEDKLNIKNKLQVLIGETLRKEDINEEDIELLNDGLASARKKNVISESEYNNYVGDLVEPLTKKTAKEIEKFNVNGS